MAGRLEESALLVSDQTPQANGSNTQEIDPKKVKSKNGVIGYEKADGFQEMTNFSIEINGYVADSNGAVIGYLARVQLDIVDDNAPDESRYCRIAYVPFTWPRQNAGNSVHFHSKRGISGAPNVGFLWNTLKTVSYPK